jgi:hypothetical protein
MTLPGHRSRVLVALCLSVSAFVGLGVRAHASSGDAAGPAEQHGLSDASARNFLLATIDEKVRGEWAKAWTSLYPFHKRIATRNAYIRCESRTPFSAPLERLRVADVRSADVRVPGLRRTVRGVALTVIVALRWYGPRDPIVFRHTFHLVPVDGHWTWLLSPSRYRQYVHGECGSLVAS